MDLISNTKIGFGGYPGFSALFNNPDRKSLSPRGRRFWKIDCQVHTNRKLTLYKVLWDCVNELGLEELYATYQFFALPPYSYHVTVADGLSLGSLNNTDKPLTTNCESLLEHFLSELPTSLCDSYDFTSMFASSTLVQLNTKIAFEFEKLTIWDRSVLVARLKSRDADQNSADALGDVKNRRAELYSRFRQAFYLPSDEETELTERRDSYSPHVSLGYFGNKQSGAAAKFRLDQWT